MPVEWKTEIKAPDASGAFLDQPSFAVRLWPHRSLPAQGFVAFIAGTCVLFALPLIGLLGTPVLWGILPFLGLAVWGMWYALDRNTRDGQLSEVLLLTREGIDLTRHNPRGPDQRWHADPYWVQLRLQPEGGPVENYITLGGSGRVVELGAFLSPEERATLYAELQDALYKVR